MLYYMLIALLSGLDIGIKNLIENIPDSKLPKALEIPLIKVSDKKIILYKSHNRGFPLGVLEERHKLVSCLPVFITASLSLWLALDIKQKKSFRSKLPLSLIIAGALSNIYDRLKRGYVVDYININILPIKKLVFNLGDVSILLGSILRAFLKR